MQSNRWRTVPELGIIDIIEFDPRSGVEPGRPKLRIRIQFQGGVMVCKERHTILRVQPFEQKEDDITRSGWTVPFVRTIEHFCTVYGVQRAEGHFQHTTLVIDFFEIGKIHAERIEQQGLCSWFLEDFIPKFRNYYASQLKIYGA